MNEKINVHTVISDGVAHSFVVQYPHKDAKDGTRYVRPQANEGGEESNKAGGREAAQE